MAILGFRILCKTQSSFRLLGVHPQAIAQSYRSVRDLPAILLRQTPFRSVLPYNTKTPIEHRFRTRGKAPAYSGGAASFAAYANAAHLLLFYVVILVCTLYNEKTFWMRIQPWSDGSILPYFPVSKTGNGGTAMLSRVIFSYALLRGRRSIIRQYGAAFWKTFRRRSCESFREVLPKVPNIGRSIFSLNYRFLPAYAAWYRALQNWGWTRTRWIAVSG